MIQSVETQLKLRISALLRCKVVRITEGLWIAIRILNNFTTLGHFLASLTREANWISRENVFNYHILPAMWSKWNKTKKIMTILMRMYSKRSIRLLDQKSNSKEDKSNRKNEIYRILCEIESQKKLSRRRSMWLINLLVMMKHIWKKQRREKKEKKGSV